MVGSGKLLLVLGMHRSGTSAVSRAMKCFGASFSDTPMPTQPENPKGYFEDQIVCNLNDRIFESNGQHWYQFSDIEKWKWGLFIEAARTLVVEDRLKKFSLFALKDPRICPLLPLWTKALKGVDVKCVICIRHPIAVANSLSRRDGFPLSHALELWLQYNLAIERARILKFIENVLSYKLGL